MKTSLKLGKSNFEMGKCGLSTLRTLKHFTKPIYFRNYTKSSFQDAITLPPTDALCFLDSQYIITKSHRPFLTEITHGLH